MTEWLILGASGHARSLASIIRGRGERIAAVCDQGLTPGHSQETQDDPSLEVFRNADGTLPELFDDDDDAFGFARRASCSVTIGVGANAIRARIAARLLADASLVRLSEPLLAASATVDATAVVGRFSQVAEHAHVGPLARLGDAVIVNTGAIVEHDCVVGAGSHLAPGAVLLGAASTGRGVFIGSGARLLPGVEAGDDAILGAGAVAVRSIPGMATYVGIPARLLSPTKGHTP
ncbi:MULTISPECIES: transferase [Arthrobacter]|uniref:Transferase n=2 Tax=Arthrobacter TaxID=1663 RepID=A0ABU9KL61_9MICC|nr:transferase [Arthrobacter sp. YJM1]MDP5227245.1 transferase [Arthrobacter sp. YJM1]